VLEQNSSKGLISNLSTTFRNFVFWIAKITVTTQTTQPKNYMKNKLIDSVTAESVCILTAETIDLIFYKYSILLSIPLALLAGAFTIVAPSAHKRMRLTN
jgi:hypothetical protein